ncbi:hypothetical protein KC318_g10611 [Hortaea werneckii]|uniref:Anaphase-promoting complex subunit 4 n=1 Tax=Hortaea werneckii TaxID=91943 RepID=A0A3M7AR31_HORWE|nr:hypothetical protein KC334_g10833 [Hortaea werneckii]KAI6985655.1 hypothetical protein KC355_g10636 [Hortaea werneckii]KAI7659535.1 hypothetical protein KC318_g10611 [Hortaea werneckii]RMY18471.1 hypothetical protein D0867_05308 [Hortaea werneckii]RMY29839.1 hypothetical protein D0866_08418 [Hortaea werneckii]
MATGNGSTTLPILSEKHFQAGAAPANVEDLVAYCDAHDLVAIATENHDVVVYRINGQPAFTIRRHNGDAEVTALKWKWDGSALAIGWNDGSFALHSGENGRLLSQGSVRGNGKEKGWKLDLAPDFGYDDDDEEGGPVAARFSWMKHSSFGEPHTSLGGGTEDESLESLEQLTTTEDWYASVASDGDESNATLQAKRQDGHSAVSALVKTVSDLDPTIIMPKLSAIPAHGLRAGPDGNKFASQAAVDAVFESQSKTGNEGVNILLVCVSDGRILVLQDDEVEIGSIRTGSGKPVACSSLAASSTHAIFSTAGEGLSAGLADIPISALSSPLLHAVALNTKRINNLLPYVTHTIRCIQHDFTTGLNFPTRLLNNANMELAEKQEEGDIVSNLFHLAMTTEFTDTMKEWLVDIVKETNHKRWDQAINTMYTNIHNHIFVNLLPALDRLGIAASALRGHARWHEGTNKFDAPPALFSNILSGVDALRLIVKKVLLTVMTEHRQFRAFSKWLRVMIDVGVAGPGTKGAAETEEREVPNLDFPLILAYIKDTLSGSSLAAYVNQPEGLRGEVSSSKELFAKSELNAVGYEKTAAALESVAGGSLGTQEPALNMPCTAVYLSAHVRQMDEQVTKWQGRVLTEPESVPLEGASHSTRLLDTAMKTNNAASTLPCTVETLEMDGENPQQVVLRTIDREHSDHSEEKAKMLSPAFIDFPAMEVIDAKFYANDILALVRDDENGYLIIQADQQRQVRIAIPSSDGFVPEHLIIGGRPGKMVCLVFSNGGLEWKALDLDTQVSVAMAEEEEGDDFDMSGMD